MKICEYNKCTGCFACANICPTNAISLEEDQLFELHPVIDNSLCINCKKCIKVCPINNLNKLEFKTPFRCFASWNNDNHKRRNSASGGIGIALAETIIGDNGVFWSTAYDENLIPIVQKESNLNKLERFQGSKYAFSSVNFSFREIEKDLVSGEKVLFTGLPCQIAGLLQYLKKSYSNLYTCDLICHGTTPSKCLTDEIDYLTKNKNLKKVTNCSFRGNQNNNFKFILYSKDKILYKVRDYSQYYFSGFLNGLTLRENCYSCPYAKEKRLADLTIGDFIGLGEQIPISPKDYNSSLVLINSEKGYSIYKQLIQNNKNFTSIERDYSEALLKGNSLKFPFPKYPTRDKYLDLLKDKGYVIAIRTLLKKDVRKSKFKSVYLLCYRVPKKLYRLAIRKINDR